MKRGRRRRRSLEESFRAGIWDVWGWVRADGCSVTSRAHRNIVGVVPIFSCCGEASILLLDVHDVLLIVWAMTFDHCFSSPSMKIRLALDR